MKRGTLRAGLHRNVYLLEFYEKENSTEPSDSFAFGVPPESESFVLTQRKTETKTFGGLVIDDYGADALKITLTGTSVNNELRVIYHTEKPREYLTGEQEILRLKQLIEKYKRDRKKFGKQILLYDLSKYSIRARRRKQVESFCWKVYPGELKITRSKDRPFIYTYSIEFTAEKIQKKFVGFETIFGVNFNTGFQAIEDYLDMLDKAFSFVRPVLKLLNNTRRFVENCKELARFAFCGTISAVHQLASDILDVGNSSFELYRETAGDAVPFAMELADFAATMAVDLMKNLNQLVRNIRSTTKKEFYIPLGVFDDWNLAMAELKALSDLSSSGMDYQAASIACSSKIEQAHTQELKIGEGKSITTYGSNVAMITDGMNFESLAKEYYGDAEKAYIIANANRASSVEDLIDKKVRNVIIPILEKKQAHFQNRIVGLSSQRDNYGRDIALDEHGNILLNETQTDFKIVSGKKNLSQAILMRLKENVNKRVRQQFYGIKTSIPDSPQAGSAYILSSIIQTLQMEPRIKELLGVSFKGVGDALYIDIDYIDIGGSKNTVMGVI